MTTTTMPKATTTPTAKTSNHAALKNFSARVYVASGSFIRFVTILALATIVATPLPFLAIRLMIGAYVTEFLLVPFFIAVFVGVPASVIVYALSFAKNKPLIQFYPDED